jgi:hypothetical protein
MGASALFAGAVAFAAVTASRSLPGFAPASAIAFAAALGLAAFIACRHLLSLVDAEPPHFAVEPFDVAAIAPIPASGADELVLTDADRLDGDALILDDVLAELGPDSRVVRLFDRAAMPTPGELGARIDHHLGGAAPLDASQDLFEALTELRRSLR